MEFFTDFLAHHVPDSCINDLKPPPEQKHRSSGPPGAPQVIDFHCVFDGFSVISNDKQVRCITKFCEPKTAKTLKTLCFS